MNINHNFQNVADSYLFSTIAKKVAEYQQENPKADIIRLGIGDVTMPLVPAVIEALHGAVDEMGKKETFHGYGPEQGYGFLKEALKGYYAQRGIELDGDEIFVSDGAKSDVGNILNLFSQDNTVLVPDPVYPVYVDTNAMAGRAGDYDEAAGRWTNLIYMPCTAENGFIPAIPEGKADMIYLCFPNNPTGAVATRAQLQAWVDYANANGSVILFDAAYEAFITTPGIPHSIFEIPGAETCAIEFRSFSKTAGFTGTRCAYTVVPKALERGGASLNSLWNRRQCTKFNGVPYVVQRGAEAVYSDEGRAQVRETLDYYLNNARVIREGLTAAGLTVSGGVDSPYVWARTPAGMPSWDFFDRLLRRANVVTTPGAGFGPSGEGYIRLTGFGEATATQEAVRRIKSAL